MKPGTEIALSAAPSFGPAVVTILGLDIPVLALSISITGLLLARSIAPPSLRKLNRKQEYALTGLLLIILFVIVTGVEPFGNGRPIGAGTGVVWGVGLGFSGLLVIEFFGDKVVSLLKALIGSPEPKDKQ